MCPSWDRSTRATRAPERCIDLAPIRIIFAGGGTGGHLFPALAIADEIRNLEPAADILFVGTKKKLEAVVVPRHGYRFETIWISGFSRKLRLANLLFPLKVVIAMMQAWTIVRRNTPDAVVGTGGYVSGPVLYAACRAGVPTLIQEQNSAPGATTRFLAKRVREVHLTFESSKKHFERKDNLFVSGNPTRRSLDGVSPAEARAYFGLPAGAKTILAVGGSLGAHTLNAALLQHAGALVKGGYALIWQTGAADAPAARACAQCAGGSAIWTNAFIERMEYAYAAADLVVCRAGATTLAELARTGKPSILVPYPHAAANHQMENALTMKEQGAAEIIEDHDLGARLMGVIGAMFTGNTLDAMAASSRRLARPDAARVLADHVLALARRG